MATQTITEAIAPEPTMHMKLGNAAPHPPAGNKINNVLRLRNIRLDPTRALEPARKKLTTIESQRIMSVFEDAIKRAEIVTALPFIMKNVDRFRVSLGSELVDLLKQHNRIQGSYKEIRAQLDDLLQRRNSQIARIEAKNAAAAAAVIAAQAEAEKKEEVSRGFFDDLSEFGDDEEGEDNEAEDGSEEKDEAEDGGEEEHEKEKELSAKGSKDSKDGKQTIQSDGGAEGDAVVEAGNGSVEPSVPSSQKASGLQMEEFSKVDVAENISRMISEGTEREPSAAPSTASVMSDYDPRIEEAMRNLGLVAQQVSHSCKNILRLFSLNPTAMKILSNDEEKEKMRDEGGQKCVDAMIELRDILMHKLLTTPEEESERMAYLDEITKRERHNASIIERMEKELKEALDDKEEEIRKKNDVIKRLQTDLHQIEKFSDEGIRRTRAEAEKQEMADAKNSDQKTQKLQSEINSLQTQLNNLIAEHREVEGDLRAKKYKVENEVDNWIQKYDQDLGERQDEYEEIDLVYTEEKKQLLELEERFATLEKEYMAIMEERRVARDKRERAQRELALLVKAATTIQAFWRSYKVRKALSKRKGAKKGKKGKGKK